MQQRATEKNDESIMAGELADWFPYRVISDELFFVGVTTKSSATDRKENEANVSCSRSVLPEILIKTDAFSPSYCSNFWFSNATNLNFQLSLVK